jgi:hypothetical protein
MVATRRDDPLAGRAQLKLADIAHGTIPLTSPKVHPLAMNRMRDYLVSSGVTKIHQLTENDTVLLAGHIRRGHGVTLTLARSNGGSALIFDDPAFALIPLRDDGLEFKVGLTWRRDRAENDDDLSALAKAAQDAWRKGPDIC